MATRNESHVHDLSTLANFIDWGKSIHDAFIAFGWTNSADTGQVNWSTIASVPTSNTSVYEIFKPGDGLTAFSVKFDYFNSGGSSPQIRITVGTGTNGTGTINGFAVRQIGSPAVVNSGATLYNCLFSGDSGRFSMMMWRDIPNTANFMFAVERSRDGSGNPTSSHFTVLCAKEALGGNGTHFFQQSVVFGVGAATLSSQNNLDSWICILGGSVGDSQNSGGAGQTTVFNGNIPLSPAFPMVGYYDNPLLSAQQASRIDLTEGATITTTIYGATHTYVCSKNQNFGPASGPTLAIAMLWE